MKIKRDFLETFEIGSDFTARGLQVLIEQGIEEQKITPFDIGKIIRLDPFLGYQFEIELNLGGQKKTITFEYQEKKDKLTRHYHYFYVAVPKTSDISQEEIDNFGLDI